MNSSVGNYHTSGSSILQLPQLWATRYTLFFIYSEIWLWLSCPTHSLSPPARALSSSNSICVLMQTNSFSASRFSISACFPILHGCDCPCPSLPPPDPAGPLSPTLACREPALVSSYPHNPFCPHLTYLFYKSNLCSLQNTRRRAAILPQQGVSSDLCCSSVDIQTCRKQAGSRPFRVLSPAVLTVIMPVNTAPHPHS